MKIIALLLALLIEQVRPLRRNNVLHGSYDALSQWLRRQFDAGEYRHGVVAWVIAVVPLTLTVFVAD